MLSEKGQKDLLVLGAKLAARYPSPVKDCYVTKQLWQVLGPNLPLLNCKQILVDIPLDLFRILGDSENADRFMKAPEELKRIYEELAQL